MKQGSKSRGPKPDAFIHLHTGVYGKSEGNGFGGGASLRLPSNYKIIPLFPKQSAIHICEKREGHFNSSQLT